MFKLIKATEDIQYQSRFCQKGSLLFGKGSEEALGGFKVMQLPLVLGTALQQATGGSYRQETLGRVPYQLYVNLHGNSKDCRRSQRGDNRIRTRN